MLYFTLSALLLLLTGQVGNHHSVSSEINLLEVALLRLTYYCIV